MKDKQPDSDVLDNLVLEARKAHQENLEGYRQQALKLYPWICGRCQREFNRENIAELTVHHKDHNHDYNPRDGSNWELLCLYCHDNEHQRLTEHPTINTDGDSPQSTYKPFSQLGELTGSIDDSKSD